MYNMWLVIFVTELDFVQLYLELLTYVSYAFDKVFMFYRDTAFD